VFLEDSEHFLEPEVIDEMVCAELPDASWDPDDDQLDNDACPWVSAEPDNDITMLE
jgi:hypothetical protein